MLIQIWSMQEEELARNSVMLDLLFVYPSHPLASHITLYYQVYCQSPPHVRLPWAIDTSLRLVFIPFQVDLLVYLSLRELTSDATHCFNFFSGGMNGFLWLSERNVFRNVIPSPVRGFPNIDHNQVL